MARLPRPDTSLLCYGILGVGCFCALTSTLVKQPLFPMQLSNVEWLRPWLLTTVIDYYGACWCLCGVIVWSEEPLPAALWCAGTSLLGSPVCCLYILSRLWVHRSLKLVAEREYVQSK